MSNPFFNCQGPQGKTRPDRVKVDRNELRFGPLAMSRVNTVPPMDYGRPGDVVVIDNTDNPSPILQVNQEPTSVGMWMKIPLAYSLAPAGLTISGFPQGFSTVGDQIDINGSVVVLNAPYTATQAAVDINGASIPNITAQVLGEALLITESTGGAVTITDSSGSATATLGIHSSESLARLDGANGVWLPMALVSSSTGPAAPLASQYITLASDPTLSNERVLTAGTGVNITDGGSGGPVTVDHDIDTVAPIAEAVDPLVDTMLVHNASTGNVEKVTVQDIAGTAGVTATEAVQQRTTLIGTSATNNIGLPLPAGAVVRRITLEIVTAYDIGTTIEVGDAGLTDRLMTAADNDPESVNTYETTTVLEYVASTQITMTIGGSPTGGSSRIIVDFIIP